MQLKALSLSIFTISYGFLCFSMDHQVPQTRTYIITTQALIEFIHKDLGVNLAKVFQVADTTNLKYIKTFIYEEFEKMQSDNNNGETPSQLLQILLSRGIPIEKDKAEKELKYAKLLTQAQNKTDDDYEDIEEGSPQGTTLLFNLKEKSNKQTLYKKIWKGINTIISESLTPPDVTSSESSVIVGDDDDDQHSKKTTEGILVPSFDILIIHDQKSGDVLITRSPYQGNKFDIGLTTMALAATTLSATAHGINAGESLGLFTNKNKCTTITAVSLTVTAFVLNVAVLGVQIADVVLKSYGNATNH